MALEIRDVARSSIGSRMPAKSLELQHTIRLIRELDTEIAEIEEQINPLWMSCILPLPRFPGWDSACRHDLAEVGDFTQFDSPDKLLAYAGCRHPTSLGNSKLLPSHGKRGSRYLAMPFQRDQICLSLGSDLCRLPCQERAEGKHYNVALSHVRKS